MNLCAHFILARLDDDEAIINSDEERGKLWAWQATQYVEALRSIVAGLEDQLEVVSTLATIAAIWRIHPDYKSAWRNAL